MIYVTSDLHFGHNKEFLFKPRGFDTIEDHDRTIIANWNSVVTENDVYNYDENYWGSSFEDQEFEIVEIIL